MEAKELYLGRRNQVTIPKDFISEDVTQFMCEKLDDGTIVLHPRVSIPAGQKYYWTARWRKGKKWAAEDIKNGRIRRHTSVASLVKHLGLEAKQSRRIARRSSLQATRPLGLDKSK